MRKERKALSAPHYPSRWLHHKKNVAIFRIFLLYAEETYLRFSLSLFLRDLESDRAVENVLATKGKQQKELIQNLLEDEKYQRDAFAALFMQQDSRHKEICAQVEQIQSELASLTMVEMTKKDLKVFLTIVSF